MEYFMEFVIKKKFKKGKEKFPQAASDIWKYISKQKKPKRYWGKSEFVYANILYLYVLIIYKIWNTVCLKIKVSQASWKAAEKKNMANSFLLNLFALRRSIFISKRNLKKKYHTQLTTNYTYILQCHVVHVSICVYM